MSMTPNQEQPVTPVNPDPLGVGPAPVVVTGGSRNQPIPREVTGVAPAIRAQVPLEQRTTTGKYLYSGTYLANAQGRVYRAAYDPASDPVTELAKLNSVVRAMLPFEKPVTS